MVSSMVVVIRERNAAVGHARVSTRRASVSKFRLLLDGSHFSFKENKRIINTPKKNDGIVSAVKKYSLADTASTVIAMLFSSIPSFFFGVLMILLFSLKLKWLPSNGIGTWKHYIMPVLTLALPTAALLSRMTRTTMLDTMKQDYIRTAKAKGCRPSRVIFFHALRNAMMPVVTQIGMSLAGLLGGAIITEQVFGLPGFGTVCLTAIKNKDTPVIMASVLFLSVLFMLIILVVDIIYAFLDPRVMYKTID